MILSDWMTNTLLLECGGGDGVAVLDDIDRTLQLTQLKTRWPIADGDGRMSQRYKEAGIHRDQSNDFNPG